MKKGRASSWVAGIAQSWRASRWWVVSGAHLSIASSRAAGKTVERVHLGGGELTPYLRFEWGYAYSAEAGEEIFLLEHPDPQRLFGDLPVHDSWLFDDAVVDANDRFGPLTERSSLRER